MIDFDYTVQRSRRRSTSIQINDGCVVIKVPLQAEDHWIQSLLMDRASWIKPRLEQQKVYKAKYDVDPESGCIPLFGDTFNLYFTGSDTESRIDEVAKNLYLSVSKRSTTRSRERVLKSFLFDLANTSLLLRTDHLSKLTSLTPSEVRVANYKRKWGQCSNLGVITLNWRIIHLPRELQDYVIIHELCHLKEMNHSSRFWSLVHDFYPDYRTASNEIKSRFSFLNW